MRNFLFSLLLLVFSFQFIHAGGDIDAHSQQDLQKFYALMEAEITLAEQKVHELWVAYNSNAEMPSNIKRLELESAITMLELKKILVANFVDTPSAQIEVIQEKLLEILQKDLIEEIDFIELQHLVNIHQD
jgi:hypothetical protein